MEYNGYLIEEEKDTEGNKTGRVFIYNLSGDLVAGPFLSIHAAKNHVDKEFNRPDETPPPKPIRPKP